MEKIKIDKLKNAQWKLMAALKNLDDTLQKENPDFLNFKIHKVQSYILINIEILDGLIKDIEKEKK